MEKLYTVSKTRPGADCGSDHELLIAKFRLKLTEPWKFNLYYQLSKSKQLSMQLKFLIPGLKE